MTTAMTAAPTSAGRCALKAGIGRPSAMWHVLWKDPIFRRYLLQRQSAHEASQPRAEE